LAIFYDERDGNSTLVTGSDGRTTLTSKSDKAPINEDRFISNNRFKDRISPLSKALSRPLSPQISRPFHSEEDDISHSSHCIGTVGNNPFTGFDDYLGSFSRHDSSSEKKYKSGVSSSSSPKLSSVSSSRSSDYKSLHINSTSYLPFTSVPESTTSTNNQYSPKSICASFSAPSPSMRTCPTISPTHGLSDIDLKHTSYSMDEQELFTHSSLNRIKLFRSSSLPAKELQLLQMKLFKEQTRSERTTLYEVPSPKSDKLNKLVLFSVRPNMLPNISCAIDERIRRPRESGGGRIRKDSF
jgi:hypothetical protein